MRYNRNRIYISEEAQNHIKKFPIILGGCGLGSVIAECALRLGFENITIVDGDKVEFSNLNRQNYTENDIALDKTKVLKERLLEINPQANIKAYNFYLTPSNAEPILKNYKIAINALDFSSKMPMVFDAICRKHNIPILHPYNLGWGGLVAVISPGGLTLDAIARDAENFTEVDMVDYATGYLGFWGTPNKWIEKIIKKYKEEGGKLSPPQLSIGSYFVASMCTRILFDIANNKKIKFFPEFYWSTLN